ncbi:GSCOCG00003127001-RA-CDS, partial [Cotesia congregata]
QVQVQKVVYSHYYPEGGWGWIIVLVGILAHLLSSGVQLSLAGLLALPAKLKFHRQPLDTSG